MIWTAPYGGSRFGSISKRLAILILPAALLVGCGDSDGGTSVPTPTAPPATQTATAIPTHTLTPTWPPTATPTTGNTSASAACTKLASCTQCFLNQRGTCLSTEDCAGRLTTDVARCINAVTGCDQQTLGTCLPFGCQGTGTGLCDMTPAT